DALRQDHAPHPAQDRRGRLRRAGRHLHARRSGRGRRPGDQPPEQEGAGGREGVDALRIERRPVRALFDRRFWLPALAASCACVLLLPLRAAAQQQPQAPVAPGDPLLGTFYKDPRPERLFGFLERLQTSPVLDRNAYPLIAGFYAAVFRGHPDDIEKLIPQSLDAKTAETVAAALRLSGNRPMFRKFQPRLAATGRDLDVAIMFVNLPARLEDVEITGRIGL